MNQKKQKATGKATDITAPKKPATDTAPLVIPKRSIIGQQTAEAEAAEKADTPVVTAPVARRTIQPVTVTDGTESDPPADKPEATEPDPKADPAPDSHAADAAPEASPEVPAATPAEPSTDTPGPDDSAEPEAPATDDSDADTDADTNDETAHHPKSKDDQQAEQTAEAVKRERELQEYIKNQKYFVPVNAAEKKSIRVSFGLVGLLLLLGLVLIDLLLDTGGILLIQKIPHTHFFNLYH